MLEPLMVTRVVTNPEALAAIEAPGDAIVVRTAPDEALVVGAMPGAVTVQDRDAIVVEDAGWHGIWIAPDATARLVERGARWSVPAERPAVVQGMMLQLPVKLWIGTERTLVLVPRSHAVELAVRMAPLL